MPNDFYTAEQAAQVSVALTQEDAVLAALINRDAATGVFEGGGKGRTVNIKVPSALIARDRGIDDVTTAIILDSLSETTVPITLGSHLYNAIGLSEGDMSLNIADFSAQVLAPQVDAVSDKIEHEVAEAFSAVELDDSITFSESNPVPTFTKLRKALRDRGIPQSNLNLVVGTGIYATLLDAGAITDASQSGSTEALREANVGRLRGFTIVESTRLDDGEILAFHRDAFTLAVRPPVVPQGASFGAAASGGGFAMRYLRDYDVMHTQDRSLVSTFAGVAAMPLYRVTRDYDATTAKVEEVAEGGVIRILHTFS